MNIALCCVKFINGDAWNNVEKIVGLCGDLSGRVDMLLFGEAFVQGFDGLTWNYDADVDIAIKSDSPETARIRAAAVKNGVTVGFGYMEKAGENVYSSFMVISARGEMLCNYRRMSVGWKVRRADGHYREGDAPSTFELNGLRFGVALCGDLWTDEAAERISACRPDAIIWPVYTDFDPDVWNAAEKLEYAARAREYCARVLLVNSVCDGEGCARGGGAYFCDGAVAKETPAGGESVLIVEV